MDNIIEILSDSARKKAVDNPKARLGDPKCWDCLTDEQRDTINEWYINQLIEDIKKDNSKENRDASIGWLSMVPVSVFSAYRQCNKIDTALHFLSCLLASLFWYSFMYYLVWSFADYMIPLDFDSKAQKVFRYIMVAAICAFAALAVSAKVF